MSPTPPTPLQLALSYVERGWQVFPLHTVRDGGACSCSEGAACKNAGKHPRTKNGFKDASDDAEQVTHWWTTWPDANIGIRTGEESNLWVLDPDLRDGGLDQLAQLEAQHGPLVAPRVRTGGGGLHLYFLWNGRLDIRSRTNVLPGIDVRGSDGYVVAVGSMHKSGKPYTWECGVPPDAIGQAPEWLLELVCDERAQDAGGTRTDVPPNEFGTGEVDQIKSALAVIPADDRDIWLKVGMALHSTRAPEARAVWDEWSVTSNKFDVADQEETWRSFKHDKHNDIGIGTLFLIAKQHGWRPPTRPPGASDGPKPWKIPEWIWKQDPLPTFDVAKAFPPALKWLSDYCLEMARVYQTPVVFCALIALGMIAGAIGGRYEVELEGVEWYEPCPLWVLVAMLSGHGKSLVFKLMREPFDEFERTLNQTEEFAAWEASMSSARNKLKAVERKIEKALFKDLEADTSALQKTSADAYLALKIAMAAKPPLLTIVGSNFTTPALSKFLMEHNERCLILDPEGSLFGHALGGNTDTEKNLDPWLKSYSCEQIKEHRIGDGTIASMERFARRPILSMAVCTQPGNLDFFRDTYAAAKGFLARFVVVVLPYSLPQTVFAVGKFDYQLREQWKEEILQLLRPRRPNEALVVTLRGESAEAFETWLKDWLANAKLDPAADADHPVGFGSAFGAKLRGMVLRIILALHVLQSTRPEASSPDLATVNAVLDVWVPLLKGHTARMSKIIRDDPDTRLAERIIRWLAKHPTVTEFSRAQLLRALKDAGSNGAISRAKDLDGALACLVETNWIRPIVSPLTRGANPAASPGRYEVHPELVAYLEKFVAAEKAEFEGPQ